MISHEHIAVRFLAAQYGANNVEDGASLEFVVHLMKVQNFVQCSLVRMPTFPPHYLKFSKCVNFDKPDFVAQQF